MGTNAGGSQSQAHFMKELAMCVDHKRFGQKGVAGEPDPSIALLSAPLLHAAVFLTLPDLCVPPTHPPMYGSSFSLCFLFPSNEKLRFREGETCQSL